MRSCAAAFVGLLFWRVGGAVAAAGAAPARWPLRGHRLLGMARRRSCRRAAGRAMPRRRAIWSGSACFTASRRDQRRDASAASGWSMPPLPPCSVFSSSSTAWRLRSPGEAIARNCDAAPHHGGGGPLVLVHNLYGQASPASRMNIRLAMLALSLTWTYDLNLYTIAYLDPRLAPDLFDWRGAIDRARPRRCSRWRRAARKVAHPAVAGGDLPVALAAGDLRLFRGDGDPRHRAARCRASTGRAALLVGVARRDDRRGDGAPAERQGTQLGASVKIAKHLSSIATTIAPNGCASPRPSEVAGRGCSAARPARRSRPSPTFSKRPAGLLLAADASGAITAAIFMELAGPNPPPSELDYAREFWSALEASGRIIELDALRNGWAKRGGLRRACPAVDARGAPRLGRHSADP